MIDPLLNPPDEPTRESEHAAALEEAYRIEQYEMNEREDS